MDFSREERRFFRDQLRQARSVAQLDAEGFQPIVIALERMGNMKLPKARGFGDYRPVLLAIVEKSASGSLRNGDPRFGMAPDALYTVVKDGRNDALHQGAYARHLVKHCTELALMIEEGLMAEERRVSDFMVSDTVCAEAWQPIALARQQMLINSFSALPIRISGEWRLITDYGIASYLAAAEDRRQALGARIQTMVDSKELKLERPAVLPPDSSIRDAVQRSGGNPVLVVDGERLLGIATPFDLL
jgi:hypothetical protein